MTDMPNTRLVLAISACFVL